MPQLLSSTIDLNLRSKDSFSYTIELDKPHGKLDEILAWAKAELRQDWRWQLVDVSTNSRPGRYVFYFDSEQDCCAFALKWC